MVVVDEVRIPLNDRPRLLAGLRGELLDAFARVLDTGDDAPVSEVESLETEFVQAFGGSHALAVRSGTAALHLALLAVDAGSGTEVVIPANAPLAIGNAVALAGARAVRADIEPTGFALNPRDVELRITPATRAVVAVHRFGEMANLPELERIARRHGVALIDDATEAIGAVLDGACAGTFGEVGCVGLGGVAGADAMGDGGLVMTADPATAGRLAALRGGAAGGLDVRMGELEAAGLRVILPHVPEWNAARQATAALYESELCRAPVTLPGGGVFSRYVIRVRYRHALRQYLDDEGIASSIPVTAFGDGPDSLEFPHARAAEREMVALPMDPLMTVDDVLRVTRAVRQFGKFSAAMASETGAAGALVH